MKEYQNFIRKALTLLVFNDILVQIIDLNNEDLSGQWIYKKKQILINKNSLLEGSKSFARDFCKKHKVTSPENITFSDLNEALTHIEKTNGPWFIKADGLAGGKGAFPAENKTIAKKILINLMEKNILGKAGNTVVVEEWMIGPELSVHVLVNGN